MNQTARFILKLVAAGLGLAALICLTVGCWGDLGKHGCCLKKHCKKNAEYDDYADEDLFDE
ncbi:MAG: hypothetical protein RRY95_01940 [Oscillospiraceae bacterium]